MDPLSVLASVVSVGDACVRLIKFLHEAQRGIQSIDEDLEAILRDIVSLQSILEAVRVHFQAEIKPSSSEDEPKGDQVATRDLWRAFHGKLTECRETLEDFERLRIKIEGDGTSTAPAVIQRSRKFIRKYLREDEIVKFRQKISSHHDNLQLLLTAANIINTRKLQSTSADSIAQIRSLRSELRRGISSLQTDIRTKNESTGEVLQSAKAVMVRAFINEHFSTPQPVSSLYRGRRTELDLLAREAFATDSVEQLEQKRFVIYGLGGAGKSQFCCKFAQENRHKFWGVFWIDATTAESVQDSFGRIARLGKVDSNIRAAKAWLSSKDRPWLLIIDSADDPDLPVEDYFPEGEKGFVLITTRNPQLRTHGNVGEKGYFHFRELESDAAQELLLRTAGEESPWTTTASEAARTICQKLGYLPLAIIGAGRAIMSRICTLHNYLTYFDQSWNRVREIKFRRRGSSASITVYSSYELAYRGLQMKDTDASRDAVELLKMFAFLYWQRIRVDTLIQAATNPILEAEDAKSRAQTSKKLRAQPKSWTHEGKELLRKVIMSIMRLGELSVLPKVLRDIDSRNNFNELRLREALKELHQMSLVDYELATDSYSMHPLVHIWVRERPDMSLAEQAVWCQAAGTALAQALLLPPLGTREADEAFRQDVLPHVEHVRQMEIRINEKIQQNRVSRRRPWRIPTMGLARSQIAQFAKFSLVYAQNGQWQKALELQKTVADYLCEALGKENPITIRLLLFMADMYWALSEMDSASSLLEDLLCHCEASYGEEHEETARVLEKLGATRWLQGRFSEAKDMHEKVLALYMQSYGPTHVDTLKAKSNLGRVYGKYMRFKEALDAHQEALEGLRSNPDFGDSHTETLMVMDSLAMTYFDRFYTSLGRGDRADIDKAFALETEVVQKRRKKLGKEHGYTLWSICNLQRIKAARNDEGDIQEAEQAIRAGLEIARRNLGPTHIGTLYGEAQLGSVLIIADKIKEAEELLRRVVNLYEESTQGHADQMVAISFLVGCLLAQGKREEAAIWRDKAIAGSRRIFGDGNPWEDFFNRKHGE